MHEIVRESTIIGKDDESCSLLIEATDREYSLRDIDDIHDSLFIVLARETRCDNITRLVEYIIHEILLILDDLIRELDLISLRINNLPDMCDDPVDRDESSLDIFFGLSAGADSGMCEVFLEFHF
jgi:hypothetical protein